MNEYVKTVIMEPVGSMFWHIFGENRKKLGYGELAYHSIGLKLTLANIEYSFKFGHFFSFTRILTRVDDSSKLAESKEGFGLFGRQSSRELRYADNTLRMVPHFLSRTYDIFSEGTKIGELTTSEKLLAAFAGKYTLNLDKSIPMHIAVTICCLGLIDTNKF